LGAAVELPEITFSCNVRPLFSWRKIPTSSGPRKEKVLHNFVDRPGCDGMPGLVIDPAGNLYGATLGDGSTTFGSVFEITP
jgi:uncharacterized repeat protein (TIGR03803 family)